MGRRGRTSFVDEDLFFITTTVVQFTRIFTNQVYCDLLVNNIKHYQLRYKYEIIGYVIMPSHFHWIISINKHEGSISDIMRDIKKYTAWNVMAQLEQDGRTDELSVFGSASEGYSDQRRKFWMPRFDDQAIRSQEMLHTKIEYIHNNPVKAGFVNLPEEYIYSSARNYLLDDHSVLKVYTEWY